MTLGLACIALADSGYAYQLAKGEYASAAWWTSGAAGFLLVTIAATAGRHAATAEEGSPEPLGWAPILLPYAPLLLAGGGGGLQPLTIVFTGPVEVVAALLVVAVMVSR